MLQINLLPEHLRKKKKASIQIPDITVTMLPILIGIGLLIIFLHITFIFVVRSKSNALKKLSTEWATIESDKTSVEALKKETTRIKKRVNAIDSLMGEKVSWSRKLNELSDLVLPGIWFTRLSIDKRSISTDSKSSERREITYLSIVGEVSATVEEELVILGRFIKQLKADPSFSRDFSSIELTATQLHQIENQDAMKFNVKCQLKEGR